MRLLAALGRGAKIRQANCARANWHTRAPSSAARTRDLWAELRLQWGPVPHAPACCVVHTHSVTVPHLLRGKSSCEGRLWVVRWFARAARVHKPVAPARPAVACRRFARASASAGAGAFMPRGTGQATEGLRAPRQGRMEGRKAGWWKCDVFHSYFSSNKQYCQLENLESLTGHASDAIGSGQSDATPGP